MVLTIDCHIYRSKHKKGLYLYLREKDNFDSVPNDLKSKLGILEFAFSTTLTETKKLVRADAKQVIKQVQEDGFFLQMPPPNTDFLDLNLHQSDGF